MRGAWLVMKKEFLELTKDKRTLFFTFVMPLVLYPALFTMIAKMSQRDQAQREANPSQVYLVDPASVLAPALKADPKHFTLVPAPAGDAAAAVREKRLDLAVEVPADAADSIKAQKTFTVTVQVNKTEEDSKLALDRLKDALKSQDQAWVNARLQAISAPAALVTPTEVQVKDASDEAMHQAKFLGIMLPYLILITMFMPIMGNGGGMTAGERERGTLMSLLSTRIPRSQIAIGKLMALFALGVLSMATNVVAMFFSAGMITGTDGAAQAASGAAAKASIFQILGPGSLLLMLILLVPVALVMVSFVLNVGIRAKTQREAAAALMPGMFVIIGLAVFSISPGIEKMTVTHWVPILNASMSIREMFGQQFSYAHYFLALGINTVLALVLTSLAAKTLDREDVLFKS